MLQVSNGDTPDLVTYNGSEVNAIVYNDQTVWMKNTRTETWQLNENIAQTMGSYANFEVTFKADGVIFLSINIVNNGSEKTLRYDTINAYTASNNTWTSNAYRTLVFDTAPLGAVRIWLQNNGTRIA